MVKWFRFPPIKPQRPIKFDSYSIAKKIDDEEYQAYHIRNNDQFPIFNLDVIKNKIQKGAGDKESAKKAETKP